MKQRHIRVPYALLDSKISNEAKCIYLALMYFREGNKKQIKVSQAKISEVAGLKIRQTQNHIEKLIDNAMLSSKQTKIKGCNIYRIICAEKYFAAIPWIIAYESELSAYCIVAYCIMKQSINLNKKDYICYMTKQDLAKRLGCAENNVDKIKRTLKEAGFIDYERTSKKIVLTYERNLNLPKHIINFQLYRFNRLLPVQNAKEKTPTVQTAIKDGP